MVLADRCAVGSILGFLTQREELERRLRQAGEVHAFRSVRMNNDDQVIEGLVVARQLRGAQRLRRGLGGVAGGPAGGVDEARHRGILFRRRQLPVHQPHDAFSERRAPLVQVLHLRTVGGRFEKRCRADLIVGDRDIETVTECAQ